MANAISLHITVTPPGGVSATNGPSETLKAVRLALVGGGYTVYDDGAFAEFVAEPKVPGEANPNAFTA